MRKLIAAVCAAYRDHFNALGLALGILGVVISVLVVIYAQQAVMLSYAALGFVMLLVSLPILIGVMRITTSDDVVAPPDEVREFAAVSYCASSTSDLKELNAFALAKFGETFPAEVIEGAVRSRRALGVRLTDANGRNIGFVDFYHFREDVLNEWREGYLNENALSLDQFAPIGNGGKSISVVLGALYIDTSNPVATHHLAKGLVDAARAYVNFELRNFSNVNVYASIFSRAGKRWAMKEGFVPDITHDKRGSAGGGHDVYVSSFKPDGAEPSKEAAILGNKCVYRISLRMH